MATFSLRRFRAARPFFRAAIAPILLRCAARWPRAVEGIAAVEFALVLPVMVTMFFGLSEVTLAINVDRKLTLLSRSLADLSTRVSALSQSDLANVFAAASAIMRPYDTSTTQMVISSILVTQSGSTFTGSVDWSCAKGLATKQSSESQASFDANNLKARPANSSYTVPPGFQTSTTKSFVLVETLLPYNPVFGQIITGTIRMRESIPWPIRNNDKVTGPGTCPA